MVLIPFDRCEALSLRETVKIAGKSETTIRTWCGQYDLGRRLGNGPWQVSRVALAMFLDGDADALRTYLGGDRHGPLPSRSVAPRELTRSCSVGEVFIAAALTETRPVSTFSASSGAALLRASTARSTLRFPTFKRRVASSCVIALGLSPIKSPIDDLMRAHAVRDAAVWQ
jgi:hypothetical protein